MQVAVGPAPRRGTQLALTILAILLSVGAYFLVVMGQTGRTPAGVGGFVAVLGLAYIGTHLLIRRLAPGADPTLFPTAAVMAGLGYAVIYRLNPGLAGEQFGWLMLSLVLFGATLLIVRDHRALDAYTYTIGLVGIILLLLPIAPVIGRTINGARLWVRLGPLTFQPAEIGKVLVVIFLASYLNAKKELLALVTRQIGPLRLPEPRYLGPLLLAWFVSLTVLFAEKDLGSSLLFFGIFVIMLWMATGRVAYLVLGAVMFAVGALIGWVTFSHVEARVDIWLHALDPEKVSGFGYGQVAQAQFGMATGGLVGSGLGQGSPDLIPSAATDFIFAALGEELGLFGTTAVLLLYFVLVGRGFRIAISREDSFSKLLATGLTGALALQTFIIVGGVTRLIPLTGITLPFMSYGGSSLVSNFVLLALLVRLSAEPPAPARPRAADRPAVSQGDPTVATERAG